jgi:DNA-binding HxlR family transcriptional regulator
VPYTQLANITGRPAPSVPLYWTDDGLPLGVQFVAPLGGEGLLLRLVAQLEQVRPWSTASRPPADRTVGWPNRRQPAAVGPRRGRPVQSGTDPPTAGVHYHEVMSTPPQDAGSCNALTAVFALLGKRWSGLIIGTLLGGPARFSEMAKLVPGVSERMLSGRLTELISAGLVSREVLAGPPVGVRYRLTARGEALRPALHELEMWAMKHLGDAEGQAGTAGQLPDAAPADGCPGSDPCAEATETATHDPCLVDIEIADI